MNHIKCEIDGCLKKDFHAWNRASRCKEHENEYRRGWYKRNKSKLLAREKKHAECPRYRANTKIISLRGWDKRKSKATICDLKVDEYLEIVSRPCIYCGEFKGIGLDRIDNKKGHSKDNVIECCSECNKTRGDRFTVEEFQIIAKAIKAILTSRKATDRKVT